MKEKAEVYKQIHFALFWGVFTIAAAKFSRFGATAVMNVAEGLPFPEVSARLFIHCTDFGNVVFFFNYNLWRTSRPFTIGNQVRYSIVTSQHKWLLCMCKKGPLAPAVCLGY